jgi:hypothetical protein
MAFDTSAAILAFDGVLSVAPWGTALPLLRDEVLAPEFKIAGWLTEDGLTFDPGVEAPDVIVGWPRGQVLKSPPATLRPTLKFACAQHDADVLELLTKPTAIMSYVLDYKDTVGSAQYRLIVPKANLTDAGEIPFTTTDLVSLEFTVQASRDDNAGYTFMFGLPDPADPLLTVWKQY